MVGYEGMTGLSTRPGRRPLDQRDPGAIRRLGAADLHGGRCARCWTQRSFTASLLRYVNVFMVQGSQTALANGRGRLDERLARWLLMWDDRVSRPTLLRSPTNSSPCCWASAGRASPSPCTSSKAKA